MVNLLWAFLGAFARALAPWLAKVLIRVSSKHGWISRSSYASARRKRSALRDLLARRARGKKARDTRRGKARGEDFPAVDETDL